MWARVVEIMLGMWLAASPFIFRHEPSETAYWYADLASAFLVITFGLLSYADRFRRAHLGTALVGLWLLSFAYLTSPYPAPPALQNHIVVGLLLMMIAIIPSEASQPPRSWRRLLRQNSAETGVER